MDKVKDCLSKSEKWLLSYAQKIILGPSAPSIKTRSQSPCQTKCSKKILSSVDHKILNKMSGCLWRSDKWLPSYTQKTSLGPIAPNLQTRSQSSCETKFFHKITWSVYHKVMNKMRGCLWKSDKWLPSYT